MPPSTAGREDPHAGQPVLRAGPRREDARLVAAHADGVYLPAVALKGLGGGAPDAALSTDRLGDVVPAVPLPDPIPVDADEGDAVEGVA